MKRRNCIVWVRGCSDWIAGHAKDHWKPYYISFKIKPCRRGVAIPQIHDWIAWQFYWRFCNEFVDAPRDKAVKHLLPQLWLFPNFPDAGIRNRRDCTIPSPRKRALRFQGILLVPRNKRFKKCPLKYVEKHQRRYTDGGISQIKLEAVYDVPKLIESNTVKWGSADEHNILILPASAAQLADDAPFHSALDEVDYIQATLRVARDVATTLWLGIYRKEGLRLDPNTANVRCDRVFVEDPYGVYGDGSNIGSADFARAPGSDLWVLWDDLPKKTQRKLEKRLSEDRADRQDASRSSDPYIESID
jgi:hypothetical protein